jgi:hypothetical protein
MDGSTGNNVRSAEAPPAPTRNRIVTEPRAKIPLAVLLQQSLAGDDPIVDPKQPDFDDDDAYSG